MSSPRTGRAGYAPTPDDHPDRDARPQMTRRRDGTDPHLQSRLGPAGCWRRSGRRGAVYARDASHLVLGGPLAVALPRDAARCRPCWRSAPRPECRWSAAAPAPGLSGGAVPGDGAVVLSTARLTAPGAGRR